MENANPNKKNDLHRENEELKKKLEEEFGAANGWTNPDLPPEMENEFLNHIMAFENAWKDAKRITLYEFLGKPAFRRIDELQPDEISTELERIYSLMLEHQVRLDTICEVSDYELYRFITEELFLEEKDDMRVPGMMSGYIYEEFYPNHEYDLNRHSEEFLNSYLDKTSERYLHYLNSEAEKQQWHTHFRDTFSRFELRKSEIINVSFNLETEMAQVDFECDFTAQVEGSRDVFQFAGKGKINFVYKWDYWTVDSVEFPKPHNGLSGIQN